MREVNPAVPVPVRLLVVDDHPAVREGLTLLVSTEGMEVCAEAGCRADALARVETCRPDLAVVDLSTSNEDALALVSELRARHVRVLVCSRHPDPGHVKQAMAAGANGYITRSEAPLLVARAMRAVLEARTLFSPLAAERLREEAAAGRPDPAEE